MFMIVQSVRLFLNAVTPTAVAPIVVILPVFTWIYLNLPGKHFSYLLLPGWTPNDSKYKKTVCKNTILISKGSNGLHEKEEEKKSPYLIVYLFVWCWYTITTHMGTNLLSPKLPPYTSAVHSRLVCKDLQTWKYSKNCLTVITLALTILIV